MNLLTIIIILAIVVYLYIKQPWKRGYMEVKENGKIMTKRTYSTKHPSALPNSDIKNNKIKNTNNPDNQDNKDKEGEYHSKFDFLFKKEKQE